MQAQAIPVIVSGEAAPNLAALAVHLMTNTAVTGATFDIDGGQQRRNRFDQVT